MKLEKAIEIVRHPPFYPSTPSDVDYANALKLLIEAGKRVQSYREKYLGSMNTPLPGETKE